MAPLSFTFVRSKYHNPLAVGTAHHRIEVELQSMRASSWRVHASGIEQNISSRNELAHNRTIHSKRGGPYLPLSPPRPVIISSFLPASFIKRCLASCIGPYLPSDSRNLSTRNTQIPLAMNQLRLRIAKNRFVKEVVDVWSFDQDSQFFQIDRWTIVDIIYPNIIFPSRMKQFREILISTLFYFYFYIIRPTTKSTRRILNRAKERKKEKEKKIDSFDSKGWRESFVGIVSPVRFAESRGNTQRAYTSRSSNSRDSFERSPPINRGKWRAITSLACTPRNRKAAGWRGAVRIEPDKY